MVGFNYSESVTGESARAQIYTNSENTIFGSKRLIGRKFRDVTLQQYVKYLPFKFVNSGDQPFIQVNHLGETKLFTPEQISSMILTKMKETAETFLQTPVKDAVVTVPCYFNDAQRRATYDAGVASGMNIIGMVDENCAAALAYGFEVREKKGNILIFHFGGGTLDVSLVRMNGGSLEVKATGGDANLGGEDFDNRLVQSCIDEFKREYFHDISRDPKAISRLRGACEKAKRTLSTQFQSFVELDSLYKGIDYIAPVSRAKFEALCTDLFAKCLKQVDKVLNDAKIAKSEVDEIVLVGGSTRIPKLRRLLSEYFEGKALNTSLNPEEAAASGAALLAAMKKGDSKLLDWLSISPVTPFTLGYGNSLEKVEVLFERNTALPTKKVVVLQASLENENTFQVGIYQGEGTENYSVGTLVLSGIPKGSTEIEVCFELDLNGMLKVSAKEKTSQKTVVTSFEQKPNISNTPLNTTAENENLSSQQRDKEAKESLQKYVSYLCGVPKDRLESGLTISERGLLNRTLQEAMRFLESNTSGTESEYNYAKIQLESVAIPLMKKVQM